ncbi:MAG: DUF1440 domain-containing protein [Candidatus Eiseniibacteriota bacterium]
MVQPPDDLRPLRTIIPAGAVAGTLDITAAIVIWALRGVRPIRILQSVASGLLGRAAFTGGFRTAALGLLLHFCIATTWAAIYYVASRKFRVLVERPLVFGPLYGVFVYAIMYYLVLPLSAFPGRPQALPMALLMVAVHIACIGTPIALMVRRGAAISAPPAP